jgi:hypothetical protein
MLLNKTIVLNNLTDRTDIYKLAASDVKKKTAMVIDPRNMGGNSLIKGLKAFNNRKDISS